VRAITGRATAWWWPRFSLALVLLVGAGLLLRSFYRVIQADAGFRAEGVLTASLPLPQTRFPDHASEPSSRGACSRT